ncbi:MAG: glycosyltransferase family 39 protein, partial [Nitrosarchaeum sp.]
MELFSKIYDHDDNVVLNTVKILIIIFVSISLIANFSPYYLGIDSFVYGISAIDLANGSYGFTNKFLQETGDWEFVPNQWAKTIHNTAIPIGSVGIYGISTIAYLIGGNYGLFYLGPLATVLLLIFSERIATNLFGRFVGFVTLLLVATDITIFTHGTQLLTDNIFTLFFIFGCFYLVKFLRDGQEKFILLCSTFFVASTFLRYNSIITLPIEIILVIGNFVLLSKIMKKHETLITENSSSNIFSLTMISKKYTKISIFLIVPWLFFFLFLFSYNQYYFGDPLTNYFDQSPLPNEYQRGSIESLLEFDINRIEWIKLYAVELLPDKLHL